MNRLSKKVRNGSACRFCERYFIDENGKRYCHNALTVCWDCWPFIAGEQLRYIRSLKPTVESNDMWALRKSEILTEIQAEIDSDSKALKLERQIRREQNKELFDERWLPKFQDWLEDDIKWDEKKVLLYFDLGKKWEIRHNGFLS